MNLKNLERNMYGHNYEVHFGINVLKNCNSIDDISKELSLNYNDDRFCALKPDSANELDLWNSIKYGFEYRGDDAAGLELTNKQEKALLIEQKRYESYIQQYLTRSTALFNYPSDLCIPYVSIFWGYSFILFNPNCNSLFTYGVATD